MEADLSTVWLEGQIDENSLSLTLMAEYRGEGAEVQEIKHFSLSELQDMAGGTFTMNLSDDAHETVSEMQRLSGIGKVFEDEKKQSEESQDSDDLMDLPEAGDVLTDENAPSWSETDWVEVREVLPNTPITNYVFKGTSVPDDSNGVILRPEDQHFTDSTVAEANPNYPDDDAVVLGQYGGAGDWYAFPASRLR